MSGYPILLVNLDLALSVVVGGGPVAERKVRGLLEAGARVTVVSPDITPGLQALADERRIEVRLRAYQPGDLAPARLVIAATDDVSVNKAVWQEATERGLLVNVVDAPTHCDFYVPSVVRRGALTISISTAGLAPALSKHLRQQLEDQLSPAYARFLDLLGDLRPRIQSMFADPSSRQAIWQRLVASDLLDLLEQGHDHLVEQRVEALLRNEFPPSAEDSP